jgi:2-keto-4-pentenoate hydratase
VSKDIAEIADRLMEAYDTATTLPPITAGAPDFSVADGYAVDRKSTRLNSSHQI